MISKLLPVTLILVVAALVSGCVTSPPTRTENICHIFDEKRGWYKDARSAEKRWGSSIPVMMSMMHQESSFKPKAKPPRGKFLWIFPGRRKSTAYGFAQAKNETWREYQVESGNRWASRHTFRDAIDFVGWYNATSQRRSKIAQNDAHSLYLAYHEGHGGFNRGTYNNKAWLLGVTRQVANRADNYEKQLAGCERRFRSSWWWPFG
jgi:hypothetical protein